MDALHKVLAINFATSHIRQIMQIFDVGMCVTLVSTEVAPISLLVHRIGLLRTVLSP
jgi:hypothetical protein